MGGADLNAGSGIAVIAPQHSKMAARVGKRALLHVLDPGAKDAYRDFVLLLARNRTGMAADASILIDDKTQVFRSHNRLRLAGQRMASHPGSAAAGRWSLGEGRKLPAVYAGE